MSALIGLHLWTTFAATSGATLGYRPFLDPVPVASDWLLVPLIVAIAVVYKAIKLEDLARLPRESAILATQIVIFMVLAAVALWLLVEIA